MSRRLAALLVVVAGWLQPAAAHEVEQAGQLRLTVGWVTEPPVAGVLNAVEVVVANADGTALADLAGSLELGVSFGAEHRRLALRPSGRPGVLSVPLLPTRPGTYALQVTGMVGGQPVDITSTCSEQAFDCVVDAGTVQFPSREPLPSELAARVERESRRLDDARATASTATALAGAAAAVAVVALAATAWAARRRHRPPS